ncbi:MAG: DUF3549 family protein [Gammaproteobacteria bacterium]|nr:DUF3549 family protein [Gammaproteobacteria bacterium]
MSDLPRTLVDFFELAGWRLLAFDLGRRIRRIGRYQFRRFEHASIPYPYPLRRHALVGFILSQDAEQDQLVWFVKFPLDEKGLLVQASRDYFLRRLFEAFAEKVRDDRMARSILEDNPFIFQPSEERMAIFRSRASRSVNVAPSQHYAHAQKYLDGELGFEQWSFVAFQGLADVVARWSEDGNDERLCRALPRLPAEPFVALATCLEHERISATLEQVVLARMRHELDAEEATSNVVAAAIRATSLGRDVEARRRLLDEVLCHRVGVDIEVLAAIAGRSWEALRQPALCAAFLGRLAEQEQDNFDAIVTELVFLPGMREPILHTLRDSASTTPILSQRTDAFFRAVKQ